MKTIPLRLQMGRNFATLLEYESACLDISQAEFIRRAVATYAFMRREAHPNKSITIVGADGVAKELILRTRDATQ